MSCYTQIVSALYDYAPQAAEELELKEGQILYIAEETEPEWWTAQNKETKAVGLIPSNYVQQVEPLTTAKAMFPYEAQTAEEISFQEGEVLFIYEKDDPSWWLARGTGKIGIIPSNYIEEEQANGLDNNAESPFQQQSYQPEESELQYQPSPTLPQDQPQPPGFARAARAFMDVEQGPTDIQYYRIEEIDKKTKVGVRTGLLGISDTYIYFLNEATQGVLQKWALADLEKHKDKKNRRIQLEFARGIVLQFDAFEKNDAPAILATLDRITSMPASKSVASLPGMQPSLSMERSASGAMAGRPQTPGSPSSPKKIGRKKGTTSPTATASFGPSGFGQPSSPTSPLSQGGRPAISSPTAFPTGASPMFNPGGPMSFPPMGSAPPPPPMSFPSMGFAPPPPPMSFPPMGFAPPPPPMSFPSMGSAPPPPPAPAPPKAFPSMGSAPPPPPPPPAPFAPPSHAEGSSDTKLATALYSYEAQAEDELSINEGDHLIVIDDSDVAWWTVRLVIRRKAGVKSEGLVPATYIELKSDSAGPANNAVDHRRAAEEEDRNRRQKEEEDRNRRQQEEEERARKERMEQSRRQLEEQRKEEREREERERETRRAAEELERKIRMRKDQEQAVVAPPPLAPRRPSRTGNNVAAEIPKLNRGPVPAVPSPANDSNASSDSADSKKSKPNPANMRTWADKTESFKVEAEFLAFKDGKVHLHKMNGVKIAVPLEKLGTVDQEWVYNHINEPMPSSKPNIKPSLPTRPYADSNANSKRSSSEESGMLSPWVKPSSSSAPYVFNGFDWFVFFSSNCGVIEQDAKTYAVKFVQERMDESILPDLDRDVMRRLGLSEGDILRVMKQIPKKDGLFRSDIPAPVLQTISEKEKEAQARNLALLDERFAKRVQEQENYGGRSVGSSLEQIQQDERLAKELQRMDVSGGGGSVGSRRRVSRPNVDITPQSVANLKNALSNAPQPQSPFESTTNGFPVGSAWATAAPSAPSVPAAPSVNRLNSNATFAPPKQIVPVSAVLPPPLVPTPSATSASSNFIPTGTATLKPGAGTNPMSPMAPQQPLAPQPLTAQQIYQQQLQQQQQQQMMQQQMYQQQMYQQQAQPQQLMMQAAAMQQQQQQQQQQMMQQQQLQQLALAYGMNPATMTPAQQQQLQQMYMAQLQAQQQQQQGGIDWSAAQRR